MRIKLSLLLSLALSANLISCEQQLKASEIAAINALSEVENADYQYYADGTLKQVTEYNDYQQVASITTYSENGILTSKTIYHDNLPAVMNEYYQNGSINKITTYQSGYRSSAIEYAKNGVITHKYQYYKTGTARGEIEIDCKLDVDGNVVIKSVYDINQNLAMVQTFNSLGVKLNHKHYTDGVLSREYLYNSNKQCLGRIDYYSSGIVKEHQFYTNGIRDYRETYDENSRITAKSTFKADGKEYLQTLTYDSNGYLVKKYNYYSDVDKLEMKSAYNPQKELVERSYYYKNGNIKRKYKYDHKQVVSKDTYNSSGVRTRKDVYRDGIRRNTYIYNSDGSYSYAYYSQNQTLERRDYYNKSGNRYKVKSYLKTSKRSGYRNLKVATCDMSPQRLGKRVVDVGVDSKYTNRDYYAYTNGGGQVVRVEAAQIIPQNEKYEQVVAGSNGITKEYRYCKSQAPLKGTETSKYDRGHVIADSMGGAANAYNITPQIKNLNRYGAQSKMENMFREAFRNRQTVTNFDMKISYKNKKTTIPYKYTVSFRIDGKKYTFTEYNK